MPQAAPLAPEALVELAEVYARQTGYPIQYQWTLLAGINDSEQEMDGIVRLLRGKYAIMNLIPYNRTEHLAFDRPPAERVRQLTYYLHRQGIRTTVRNSAGQEVDGGCGQLRSRQLVTAQPAPVRVILPAVRSRPPRSRMGEAAATTEASAPGLPLSK